MQSRYSALRPVLLLTFGLAACGGGSSLPRDPSPSCGDGATFCVVSCNLGCSTDGTCSITEIAQNQPIVLRFSDRIDPGSVNASTVSIRTVNGRAPVGRFLIDGSTLTFQPEARLVGGLTQFGFSAGETYILSIPGAGSGATLTSDSGDPIASAVLCTLRVSQGLIDLDGRPPTAELVLPTTTDDVPLDTSIVLRFSELLDVSSFQGGTTVSSPIAYQIRRTRSDPLNPGRIICDSGFEPVRIEGVPIAEVDPTASPPVTIVTLRPAVALPKRVCVEVIVTPQVRDLAGTPAQRREFRFFTEAGTSGPVPLIETFASDARLDSRVSGGTWGGGRAVPAILGGSGRDGTFRPDIGNQIAPNVFELSTDSQVIPLTSSLFGDSRVVTDGRFEFTDMVIPSGVKVVFRGSNPAIIRVRGLVQIDGELSVEGQSPSPTFNGAGRVTNVIVPGDPGAGGGAGGGSGGTGADSCLGNGADPRFSGRPGEAIRAPAASGYFGLGGSTGGGGGPLFPASGLDAAIQFNLILTLSGQSAGGGAGGAFLGNGTPGTVVQIFTAVPTDRGPDSVGGQAVPIQLAPPGVSTFDHYLVGGAGGGGGGSQPWSMSRTQIQFERREWNAAAGGGGGGGALALRAGGRIDNNGTITARGGRAVAFADIPEGTPSPGGGGSGGSLVFQVPNRTQFRNFGTLDIAGGEGGRASYRAFTGTVGITEGGDGGHGAIRLEAGGTPTTTDLGTVTGPAVLPAEFVGELPASENDTQSGFTSLWRATREIFPPQFLYYRVTVNEAGTRRVYTDQLGAEFNPANDPNLPLRIWFQGGDVNAATNALIGEAGPWRDFINPDAGPSINSDGATGFRWMIIFNRSTVTDIEVEQVEVWFQG